MNEKIVSYPAGSPNFVDSKNPLTTEEAAARSTVIRVAPPNYAVLRQGSQSPDRFAAASDEEAWATVRRQVRFGQTGIVYLYKLIGAEMFEPSSVTLTPEQILERVENSRNEGGDRDNSGAK